MSENRTVRKRAPRQHAPVTPPPPEPVTNTRTIGEAEIIYQVPLGDSREVRILRIPTGREDLIRVGINLLPNGENMSGAVFPESYVDDVIAGLRKVHA